MERRPPFCFITGVMQTSRILRLVAFTAVSALAAAAPGSVSAQTVRKGLPGSPQRDTTPARRPAQRGMGTIDGFIGDTTLTPIQAAEVKILSSNVKVATGPNGRFRISQVPVGQYVIVVRRAGYRPASALIEVGAADTLRLSYSLERAATTLSAAVITEQRMSAKMVDFNARKKVGFGEFMTEEQISKRNAVYTTELMRRFMSIIVGPSNTSGSGGMPEWLALSKREGGSISVQACPMVVMVDGVTMPTPFNLDYLPSPKYLAGIEVYNGAATVPAQFSGMNRGCGVILVWTKDGT